MVAVTVRVVMVVTALVGLAVVAVEQVTGKTKAATAATV